MATIPEISVCADGLVRPVDHAVGLVGALDHAVGLVGVMVGDQAEPGQGPESGHKAHSDCVIITT